MISNHLKVSIKLSRLCSAWIILAQHNKKIKNHPNSFNYNSESRIIDYGQSSCLFWKRCTIHCECNTKHRLRKEDRKCVL